MTRYLIGCVLLVLLSAHDASAAWGVRQIKTSTRTTATSLTTTFASTTLATSTIVASSAIYNSGGSGNTVSDATNGTYTQAWTTSGDVDSELWQHYFANAAAITAVTTNPGGTSSDNDLTLFEVEDAATSTPLDVAVTNTGTWNHTLGAGTSTVTTATLAQADEVVISGFSHNSSDSALTGDSGDGFTQADENEVNSGGQTFHWQYKVVTVTTSLVVNGTIAQNILGANPATWFTGVGSYKKAVAGGVTPKMMLLGVGP